MGKCLLYIPSGHQSLDKPSCQHCLCKLLPELLPSCTGLFWVLLLLGCTSLFFLLLSSQSGNGAGGRYCPSSSSPFLSFPVFPLSPLQMLDFVAASNFLWQAQVTRVYKGLGLVKDASAWRTTTWGNLEDLWRGFSCRAMKAKVLFSRPGMPEAYF